MAEPLSIDNVHKRFGSGVVALDGVSLAVEAGTFLVLLGPSGSGKTTLIRSVAGIERISAGRITIGNHCVASDRHHVPSERRRLSMVFQDYALWPHLTAVENVAFALRRHRLSGAERSRRAGEMLERVGLGPMRDRYPSELSGGEQQRVALARSLVGEAALVLCDEPLSNLDADLRERMRVEISELVRESGATALYITHDQSEAFALADRVGVLQRGALVQLAEPEEVYARPATPFVARFTGVAAELEVKVTGPARPRGRVGVEPVGLPLAREVVAEAVGPVPAGRGRLIIRPSAVSLCEATGEDRHVVGTVADVAFRGRGYELAVDLIGGGRVSGVFSSERVARGGNVGLRLAEEGCLVYAEAPHSFETESAAAARLEQETEKSRLGGELAGLAGKGTSGVVRAPGG